MIRLAALLLLLACPAWAGPPVVDGTPRTGTSGGSSTVATSVALTTSFSADLVLVAVFAGNNGGTLRTVSSVACGSLNLARRVAVPYHNILSGQCPFGNPDCQTDLEVWSAAAAGTISCLPTATLSGVADGSGILAFAVNGVHSPSPWDLRGAPASAENTSGGNIQPSLSFSTVCSNDFIVAYSGNAQAQLFGTPGDWTEIAGLNAVYPFAMEMGISAAYQAVTTPTSISTTPFTASTSWIIIGDAVQNDTSGTCAPPPTPNLPRRPFAKGWPP